MVSTFCIRLSFRSGWVNLIVTGWLGTPTRDTLFKRQKSLAGLVRDDDNRRWARNNELRWFDVHETFFLGKLGVHG